MEKKKNKIERRSFPGTLAIRSNEDGSESRTIEGMAIVFNKASVPLYEDDTTIIREVIAPEAVTREFLDRQDILCTLYHDNDRILARSLNGKGTLSYDVTEEGVRFSFEAPDTVDGQTALDLVRRGDVNGCSFAFCFDPSSNQDRTVGKEGDKKLVTFTVREMQMVSDFTLTPRPAYADTEVGLRMRSLIEPVASPEPVAQDWKEEAARLRSIADNNY